MLMRRGVPVFWPCGTTSQIPEIKTLSLENSIIEKVWARANAWPKGGFLNPEKYKRIPAVSSTNSAEPVPQKIASSENKLTMPSTSELVKADKNLWNTSSAWGFLASSLWVIEVPAKAIINRVKNELISSFIALSLKIPIHSPRIVCTSKIGKLSVQVRVPSGVGLDMIIPRF